MKISLNWLGDHVDLSGISPEEIADQLTMRIALIEGLERPGEMVRDVRVGEVLEREQHPNADRLSLCKVTDGRQTLDVVCGAPNVASGQKIAWAPPGAVLPGGFKLEKRKLRGVVSHGMICSEKELGLGDDHDGIIVLDAAAVPGTPLAEAMGLDDVLLEIDNKTVTHRADLWGHYGFARELAAIFERPLKPLGLAEGLSPDPAAFPIRIDDLEGCPVYLGLMIEGVSGTATSPEWIARRLRAAEMRPINLLVDLSNYVMLDVGQPTHPFDADTLEGGIVVRRAREGETLTTLDGVERKLHPDDLMIADEGRSVAIAGIMGGGPTEVSASTKRVLLESANFDAISVRRSSSRLGLRTDALARFEKFLDPALTVVAVRRYAQLLQELQPEARIAPGHAQAGEIEDRRRQLQLRPERARLKLGYELSDEEMGQRLRSIGFEVEQQGELLEVEVPSFRGGRDIGREDDLIEEVGRLAGYSRVPAVLPRVQCTPPVIDPGRRLERRCIETLVHECGYTETLNYSFATDRQLERYYGVAEGEPGSHGPFLRLPHPITQDASRLRRSLVPGLLEQLAANQLHRDEVRMVELGRSYLPELVPEGTPESERCGLHFERRELVAARRDTQRDGESLLLELRSDVEALLRRLRLSARAAAPDRDAADALRTESLAFAHPTRCIEWTVGEGPAIWAAELHPELARQYELEGSTVVLFADLSALVEAESTVVRMQPLPQFPAARRDLSVLAPLEATVGSMLEDIQGVSPRITKVELFDVYRGKGVPEGHRSLAFRVEYRHPDKTLTDKDVEKIHAKVVAKLDGRGIKLRG